MAAYRVETVETVGGRRSWSCRSAVVVVDRPGIFDSWTVGRLGLDEGDEGEEGDEGDCDRFFLERPRVGELSP